MSLVKAMWEHEHRAVALLKVFLVSLTVLESFIHPHVSSARVKRGKEGLRVWLQCFGKGHHHCFSLRLPCAVGNPLVVPQHRSTKSSSSYLRKMA